MVQGSRNDEFVSANVVQEEGKQEKKVEKTGMQRHEASKNGVWDGLAVMFFCFILL